MSEKVKFTFNDKEIEAVKGQNLLHAILKNGEDVAHYCYHAGLSIAGVCRMCMVEQEGVPRPFPSCNATVAEGIKVRNDSPRIKESVEKTLQLHLVNHPLDCPVCDQAGECGLQDYYMKHGGYDSSMIDKKVHKDKVQDIGRNVMLDAERCILCTRCTRFTTEVTKSYELGILNRGDHAEITVNSQLNNSYAQNLVDICPVGALTSKDFRFQQRVWFLEDIYTTCIGCETGCSVKVSENKVGAFRVKPVFDEEVNGYWMCDDGREIYKHVSSPMRLSSALKNQHNLFVPVDEDSVRESLKTLKRKIILSSYLTNEELENFFQTYKGPKDHVALYEHKSVGENFDGILKRGNKNPNHHGAKTLFSKHGFDSSEQHCNQLLDGLSSSTDALMFVIPEMIPEGTKDQFLTALHKVKKAKIKIGLTHGESLEEFKVFDYLLPLPTFLEKNGTMVNFSGKERRLNSGMHYGDSSKDVSYYSTWGNV